MFFLKDPKHSVLLQPSNYTKNDFDSEYMDVRIFNISFAGIIRHIPSFENYMKTMYEDPFGRNI